MSINDEIIKALAAGEGVEGASSDGAFILTVLKPIYQDGQRQVVLDKIKHLQNSLGIVFPDNYVEILEQD
ncbi:MULTISPECIES: hypothetical protein [Tatumella]|uniref:hypothetical protein n=1 Tax=Tatumella TaxID=82986 RepID=UPI0004A366A4|nr:MULTISPECIES: hypothetical protein [Tatumella]